MNVGREPQPDPSSEPDKHVHLSVSRHRAHHEAPAPPEPPRSPGRGRTVLAPSRLGGMEAMASHVDLLTELQLLEKVPTLERLRAAQKRRAQQLKKWAQYEQDLQHRKRKHERKRSAGGRRKKVTFEASVALLEASLRNDAEEGRPLAPTFAGGAWAFLPLLRVCPPSPLPRILGSRGVSWTGVGGRESWGGKWEAGCWV